MPRAGEAAHVRADLRDQDQATIAELDAAIAAALAPYRPAVEHLVTIPGVSTTAALQRRDHPQELLQQDAMMRPDVPRQRGPGLCPQPGRKRGQTPLHPAAPGGAAGW